MYSIAMGSSNYSARMSSAVLNHCLAAGMPGQASCVHASSPRLSEEALDLLYTTGTLAEMELDVMTECLAHAKRYRNTAVSGACRLAAEILSCIFSLAQEGWNPERDEIAFHESRHLPKESLWRFTRGWMVITEVCHEWRKASFCLRKTRVVADLSL